MRWKQRRTVAHASLCRLERITYAGVPVRWTTIDRCAKFQTPRPTRHHAPHAVHERCRHLEVPECPRESVRQSWISRISHRRRASPNRSMKPGFISTQKTTSYKTGFQPSKLTILSQVFCKHLRHGSSPFHSKSSFRLYIWN